MKLLRFFTLRPKQKARPLLSAETQRRLDEAEGKLAEALADHAMKMDWARRIAQGTLEKLDERHTT